MATGITKRERQGADAISALSPQFDDMPLPDDSAEVRLDYPGKASEQSILRYQKHAFVEVDRNGKISPVDVLGLNAFVLADNFYGLHQLLATGQRASLIYLDPPYGTGMDFQSRALEHAYDDSMSQAAYTEFMRRRLILMREALSDDGAIYVHIGHHMLAHVKLIMDEIFGARNFRNIISRRKCSSKNYTRRQYPNLNDYLLFYSKSTSYKWHPPGRTPDKEWIEREYPRVDDRGNRYKLVPVHAPGTRHGETGKPWRGTPPPRGKHWQYSPDKLDELDDAGMIHWSRNGNPRRKVYLPPDKTRPHTDYWEEYRDAHHQSVKITGYPTEKNLSMINMLVQTHSDPGDLIVDPFCGSGTTLQAARDAGRNWLGMDASFTAAKCTLERMRYGPKAMGDYVNRNGHSGDSPRTAGLLLTAGTPEHASRLVADAKLCEFYESELESLGGI